LIIKEKAHYKYYLMVKTKIKGSKYMSKGFAI